MPSPSYYKPVDISLLTWGLTIPLEFIADFQAGDHLRPGSRSERIIRWGNKTYHAHLYNKHQSTRKRGFVYQLIWATDKDLLKRLRKVFVHTFVVASSQKEEARIRGKVKTRTGLPTALELLVLTPKSNHEIELKVFYKVNDEWTPFLEHLLERNVFPWLLAGPKSKEYLYQRSTAWYPQRDLKNHLDAEMVIYYLADTERKEIYVGKANRLGQRVRPGRPEIPGWDRFRYDVVRPQYAHLLGRIEENAIRTFASILRNKKGLSSLRVGGYTLANRNIPRLE